MVLGFHLAYTIYASLWFDTSS